MIEYKLINGGYEIYVNGAKTIYQPHSPTRGLDVPLTEAQAERLAKLVCKKLEVGAPAIVESAEEAELMIKTTDTRIQEIANISLVECSREVQESQITMANLQKEIQDLKEIMEELLADKKKNITKN